MTQEQFLRIDGIEGVNQRSPESRLKGPKVGQQESASLELREAQNVDVTDVLSLRSRPGFSKKLALTSAHSATSFGGNIVCCANGQIVRIVPKNWTMEVLVSGINPNALVSWAAVGDTLFWTNGEAQGRIKEGGTYPWGLERPSRVQGAAVASGGLSAGDYQVALTFLFLGEESGATIGTKITVPEGGGIALSNLPQGGDTIRVYVSRVNAGEGFVRHSDLPLGTTTFNLGKVQPLGKRLTTQGANKPPIGHIVRYSNNGRLLIARGNTVFYTLPQQYGLCRLGQDFLPPFPDRIKMIRPVADGFFVDCGDLFFVKFPADVPELVDQLGSEHSCVEGTDVDVPGYWFGSEEPGTVGFWWTKRGWPVLGMNGGKVLPIGQDKMAVPPYSLGATLAREREGLRQLLTSFQLGGDASVFACTDTLTATVRHRN